MIRIDVKPETQYIFDIEELEPGDILLSCIPMCLHDESTWGSHLIQTLTRSCFSFAALYLGNGLGIEAVGSGVARLSFAKAGIHDARNVRVLRVRESHKRAARKAAALGLRYLQRGYCRSGSPWAKGGAFSDLHRAAVVGSGLVASAYLDAGFALFEARAPYTIFPGDFLSSTILEDITASVLRRAEPPLQSTFHVDDSSLFERVHNWEVATQLKILCNYEVRRLLDIKSSKPSSMRELELLIAEARWSALDEAVNRSLRWYRYADIYCQKQQRFLGNMTEAMLDTARLIETIRLIPATLHADRLASMTLAVAIDLFQLEQERSYWQSQRDFYSGLQQRYAGKTFAYLFDVYNKQLTASERSVQFKREQQHLYRNEVQRRGLQLKSA